MASGTYKPKRQSFRAIRDDGVWLSGGVEDTGVVLEILPRLAQAVQCAKHHQPMGTTHGKRYVELHPHGAEAKRVAWQRELLATIARNELRALGIAHPCDDYDGMRHPVQGGGCGSHP